jgi:hypothetical protein
LRRDDWFGIVWASSADAARQPAINIPIREVLYVAFKA